MFMRNRFLTLVSISCVVGLICGGFGASAQAQPTPGAIAYVRGTAEIRLIEADGANDRSLWMAPAGDLIRPHTIKGLDWRPDAGELAFASDHERSSSIFEQDIYTIRPDGSNLRKLTNGPVHEALTSYPKGSVTITVLNYAGAGPYLIYLAGATEPQSVTAAGSQTLTFQNVADFGPGLLQGAVAIFGLDRWYPGSAVATDVQPGQTVHGGTLTIVGAGTRYFGAFLPSWRSDGSKVGFMRGCGAIKQVSANPSPGSLGDDATKPNVLGVTCFGDWAPVASRANQVLYSEYFLDETIYLTTEGSTDKGEALVVMQRGDALFDLQWLPDGSGFLYVVGTDFSSTVGTWQTANIYVYDFSTRRSVKKTDFSGALAITASVSPDRQWIAFGRADTLGGQADLWVMSYGGGEPRLLVRDGHSPAWSMRASQLPSRAVIPVYVPMIQR